MPGLSACGTLSFANKVPESNKPFSQLVFEDEQAPTPIGYEEHPIPEFRYNEAGEVDAFIFEGADGERLNVILTTNTDLAFTLSDLVVERERQINELIRLGLIEEKRTQLLSKELQAERNRSWWDQWMIRGLVTILTISVVTR